jgi:hypothetical protein
MVCLYDEQGTIYDVATQSHLCYQTFQAIPQGKYCMPYEPISSQQLNLHLNEPDIAINRVLSDIGNSASNILLCLLVAIMLDLLVNLVLLRTAIFLKLVGWVTTSLNALLLLAMTAIAFLRLSDSQKKYCLGQASDCQFGDVLTYTALGYLLASFTGLFIVVQALSYKRIY